MQIRVFLTLLLLAGLSGPAWGQDEQHQPARDAPAQAQAQNQDPEAATQAYLARLSTEDRARSEAYWNGGYGIALLQFIWTLALAALLLFGGWSAKIRDRVEGWSRRRWLQTAFYAIIYGLLIALLSFPLTVYVDFIREHQYGLANQNFGEWFGEQLTQLMVGTLMMTGLVLALYAVIRRAPRRWWLWGAGIVALFFALVLFISPVFLEPIFNTYQAMEPSALKDRILAMAQAEGIAADNVFQFDASRQSGRISANVSGFLGTMRIALNDNLLERCSDQEVLAVMAHEMGHYLLHHIYLIMGFLAVLAAAGLAFVHWGFAYLLPKFGPRWGLRDLGDVAGLPLLVALIAVYSFVIQPVSNNLIRAIEVQADVFSLDTARQADGFAEVVLKLAEYRKLDPSPVEEFLFYDHPSGQSRIRMAMRWKQAQLDQKGSGKSK